jgi:hypothetical protein
MKLKTLGCHESDHSYFDRNRKTVSGLNRRKNEIYIYKMTLFALWEVNQM